MGDWRADTGAVRHWKEGVVAAAFLGLGFGVLLAAALMQFAPGFTLGPMVAVWAGMLAAIIYAFAHARPTLLLRFRLVDVLYGLGFAVALRLVDGWLQGAEQGAAAPFPSYAMIGDALGRDWWLAELLGPVVVAPVVEELFFRAVVLVGVYVVVRRLAGQRVAAVSATIVSIGAFVMLHSFSGMLGWADLVMLIAVGAVTTGLVFATGRVWGAVLLHAFFNATYVALALVGTTFG